MLEQTLRQNGFLNNNAFYSPTSLSVEVQSRSPMQRAAVLQDPTAKQMEDLRQKIAERRVAPPATTWMNRIAVKTR